MKKRRQPTSSPAGTKIRTATPATRIPFTLAGIGASAGGREAVTALQDGEARLVPVNDVTARRQAEAALRESEARYRAIFEQAADAVVVFDPKTLAIVDFNDEACRRLGYSRQAFAKLKISDLDVIESAADARRHCRKVTTDNVEVFETKHRTKSGAVLDVEIRAKAICLGGRTLIQGIWHDITARKQAEEALRNMAAGLERQVEERTAALRDSAERLQMTLVAAHVVAWELDLASGTLLESGPVAALFGKLEGFRHGNDATFFESVHPDDRVTVRAQVERAMQRGGANLAAEFRVLLPDGGIRWVASSGSIERDAAGRPVRLRGVSRDITEERRAQEELAVKNEQLRILAARLSGAQEDERRRIAQGLHDNVAQSLVAGQLTLEVLRKTAATAKRAVLVDQVDRLLRDAAREIRELVFELSSPTLQKVGLEAAVLELCAHREATCGVHVEVQWDGRHRPVTEELRVLLYRAARELLLNVARHAGVKRATVRLSGARGRIRITVADKGRGFDAAKVGVTVRRTGGFGLYNIRERLQSVGGILKVRSAPGKGTQAIIEAPARQRSSP